MTSRNTMGNSVRISFDQGATWTRRRRVPASGMASMVELKDSRVLIAGHTGWANPTWMHTDTFRVTPDGPVAALPPSRSDADARSDIFLGFPTRYIERGWCDSMRALPGLEHRQLRSASNDREGMALTDDLQRSVTWKTGPDVSKLAGQPVRLRFVMQDADLYSLRFTELTNG